MFRSNLERIKGRFTHLLIKVKAALEKNNVNIEEVHQILVGVLDCSDRIPSTNLSEMFRAASQHKLWDYIHHSPVEMLVDTFIRDQMSLVSEYKKYLSGFCAATRLIEYIEYGNVDDSRSRSSELPLNSYSTEYETLTVKLNTGRSISFLSLEYVQELWISLAEEFKIPSLTAVIDRILRGCLEITWRIPPREAKKINYCSTHRQFFHQHKIIFVSISGHTIYDVTQTVSPKCCAKKFNIMEHNFMLCNLSVRIWWRIEFAVWRSPLSHQIKYTRQFLLA